MILLLDLIFMSLSRQQALNKSDSRSEEIDWGGGSRHRVGMRNSERTEHGVRKTEHSP